LGLRRTRWQGRGEDHKKRSFIIRTPHQVFRWDELIWLRIGKSGGIYKISRISGLAEDVLYSEEGSWFIDLFDNVYV
jgi:hypothetical protein